MKNFLTVVALAFCASFLAIGDADAQKRLGSGKSTGMQKNNIQKDAPKAPAQNTVAPAGAAAPAAAAPSGMSRWMGPLAGLAAGGLLASMFMGGGFSGLKMMDILLFAGLAFGAFMLFRMYMRKKAIENGHVGAAPMQYAGTDRAPRAATATPFQSGGLAPGAPEIGSKLMTGADATPAAAPRIPADFDLPGFERQARAALAARPDLTVMSYNVGSFSLGRFALTRADTCNCTCAACAATAAVVLSSHWLREVGTGSAG